MHPSEYDILATIEPSYWWYRGLRAIMEGTLRRLELGPGQRVLDVGCGTGMMLRSLQTSIGIDGVAVDHSPDTPRHWRQNDVRRGCLGSANALPFLDGVFDAVLGIDVLECPEVQEEQMCRECWRVTRPGGYLVLVAPAFGWLHDPQHERVQRGCRRYTKRTLASLLDGLPARCVRMTYLFPTTLPLVAGGRFLQQIQRNRAGADHDFRRLPATVNGLLGRVVDLESAWLARSDFLFGSSLLAVFQRPRAGVEP